MKHLSPLLQHYLLISLTIAFAAGIWLYWLIPVPLLFAVQLSALLLCLTLFCYRQGQKRLPLTHTALLFCAAILGLTHASFCNTLSLQNTHIRTRISSETDVVLTGTLHKTIQFNGEKSTLLLQAHHIRRKSETDFTPVHGLVQLHIKENLQKDFTPGTELIIRAQLTPPYRYSNPGSFDYPAFLAARNIYITGRIRSVNHVSTLQTTPSWLHNAVYFPENIRSRLQNLINTSVSPEHAGIYKALLIGDRSGVSPATLENFKASGCLHILAISGLHMSLLAATLFFCCYWSAKRSEWLMLHFSAKKLALIITIPPLCGYALIAGAQTPVLRSLIMVLVFILAFCSNRKHSPFTTLSFAALLILLLNPLSLFTVSFQLSFAAVASLILILPHLKTIAATEQDSKTGGKQMISRISHWICAAFFISMAATIGTAPLLIHAFHRISTVGPLANLLVEPLLCFWSLPLGLLAAPLSLISPRAATQLLQIGEYGVSGAVMAADFFSSFSFTTLWFATPSIIVIFLYYAALSLFFTDISRKKSLSIFLATCLLFFFPWQMAADRLQESSEITFLDVGQGSSTFLALPGGQKLIIDGGGNASPRFNAGRQIIAPYLWQRGITAIDAIVITHPDSDHYNGIPFLLKRFHPKTLWINGESGHNQEYEDLLKLAQKLGTDVRTADRGINILQREDIRLTNLGNPYMEGDHQLQPKTLSSNDTSLILRFQSTGLSCLFPGDISRRVEHVLVLTNKPLQTRFLLSPHHGSKTSNSEEFLRAVAPQQIIVSAGRFHPRTFPSTQLRQYCQKAGIPLLTTAENGAISIRQHNGKVSITTVRNNPAGQ